MLESNFSEQREHSYKTKAFPIFKEAHEDRLFKHVTFFEKNPNLTMRLSAVDHNYSTKSNTSSTQKKIVTELVSEDPTLNKFRIKSVLNREEQGISESFWVGDRQLEGEEAGAFNQYRIRGISEKNWKGDWVYSEIKDQDNDLIVYNMIYDVIDLMLTVNDKEIDYLMDYLVKDAFTSMFEDISPEVYSTISPDEVKRSGIKELLEVNRHTEPNKHHEQVISTLGEKLLILGDALKSDFKESVMASQSEFSQLFKLYNLVDRYKEKNTDFLYYMLEIFFEDRYEKIVQNANLEVLSHNDEEMGVYLNTTYEFDIKTELVTALWDASFSDNFVVSINDAVQLITDSDIYESLVYSSDENVEKFLRMALSELFAPMVGIDKHLLEVESELEDIRERDMIDSVSEYSMYTDESEMRHALLYDILEVAIKGDMHPENDHHTYILDKLIQMMVDSRKTLLFTYDVEEVLDVYLNLGESFRKSYSKEFNKPEENLSAGLIETPIVTNKQNDHPIPEKVTSGVKEGHIVMFGLNTSNRVTQIASAIKENHEATIKLNSRPLKEAYQASIQEAKSLIPSLKKKTNKENVGSGILETFGQEFKSFLKEFDLSVSLVAAEEANNHLKKDIASYHDSQTLSTSDTYKSEEIYLKEQVLSALKFLQVDHYSLIDINIFDFTKDIKKMAFSDDFKTEEMITEAYGSDEFKSSQTDEYHNLFKHYLINPKKFPMLDKRMIDFRHELSDKFQMDGTDLVKYTFGSIDDSWPLGVFRLGVNTLSSEVLNT